MKKGPDMQNTRLNSHGSLAAVAAFLVVGSATFGQCAPTFDSMVTATAVPSNSPFLSAVTGAANYTMITRNFLYPTTSGAPMLLYGSVMVGTSGMACGAGGEMVVSAASLEFVATAPAITYTELRFGDYGNGPGQWVNLSINGSTPVIFDNIAAIHGLVLGGVKVEVLAGGTGNDCGRIRLTRVSSNIAKFQIGGQQFFVDCVKSIRPGDINGDNLVNGNDLAIVLSNWGECD